MTTTLQNGRWLLAWALCLTGCLEGTPQKNGGGSVDSATHWLSSCGDDDACGDGLSCICGVCNVSCDADDACADLDADARCTSTTAAGRQCDTGGTATTTCELPCDAADACGDGRSCTAGFCGPTESGPTIDAGLDGTGGGSVTGDGWVPGNAADGITPAERCADYCQVEVGCLIPPAGAPECDPDCMDWMGRHQDCGFEAFLDCFQFLECSEAWAFISDHPDGVTGETPCGDAYLAMTCLDWEPRLEFLDGQPTACPPTAPCGDGQIDAGEQCDPGNGAVNIDMNLAGQSCQSIIGTAGTLSCSCACTFDVSACNAP